VVAILLLCCFALRTKAQQIPFEDSPVAAESAAGSAAIEQQNSQGVPEDSTKGKKKIPISSPAVSQLRQEAGSGV
jgi:hypothetical protein